MKWIESYDAEAASRVKHAHHDNVKDLRSKLDAAQAKLWMMSAFGQPQGGHTSL